MRALIVSDIHSNLEALRAVLEDATRLGGFDEVWCLGDIVGYGPDPNECIALLCGHTYVSVVANHDLAAIGRLSTRDFNLSAALAAQWTAAHLSPQHAELLASLPETDMKGDFTLVHGSLRRPVWEYVVSADAAGATFRLMETPFCLVGHSHMPFICRQLSMISLACLTLMNQLMFKHSSRSRPLKLSAKAFSTGLPGRIKLNPNPPKDGHGDSP